MLHNDINTYITILPDDTYINTLAIKNAKAEHILQRKQKNYKKKLKNCQKKIYETW